MRRKIGFLSEPCAGEYDQYIGRYVTIHTNIDVFAGKIARIDGDCAILNPHKANVYTESRLNHKLVYKDARVSLLPQHLVAIYPKTKRELQNFCAFMNSPRERSNF